MPELLDQIKAATQRLADATADKESHREQAKHHHEKEREADRLESEILQELRDLVQQQVEYERSHLPVVIKTGHGTHLVGWDGATHEGQLTIEEVSIIE